MSGKTAVLITALVVLFIATSVFSQDAPRTRRERRGSSTQPTTARTTARTTPRNQAVALRAQAKTQLAAGDLDGAKKSIESALAIMPQNLQLRVDAAIIYDRRGDYENALTYYRDVLGTPAWIHAAPLLFGMEMLHKDYDAVLADTEVVCASHLYSVEAWAARSSAFMCKGETRRAFQTLALAVLNNPDYQKMRQMRRDFTSLPGVYDGIREYCIEHIEAGEDGWDAYAEDLARAAIASKAMEKFKADVAAIKSQDKNPIGGDGAEGIAMVLSGQTGPEAAEVLSKTLPTYTSHPTSCKYAAIVNWVAIGNLDEAFQRLDVNFGEARDDAWCELMAQTMAKAMDRETDDSLTRLRFCEVLASRYRGSKIAAENLAQANKLRDEDLRKKEEKRILAERDWVYKQQLPDMKLAPKVTDLMEQAAAAEVAGDWKKANECYSSVHEIAPKFDAACFKRAVNELILGEIDQACADVKNPADQERCFIAAERTRTDAIRDVVSQVGKRDYPAAQRLAGDYLFRTSADDRLALLKIRTNVELAHDLGSANSIDFVLRVIESEPQKEDHYIVLAKVYVASKNVANAHSELLVQSYKHADWTKVVLTDAQIYFDSAKSGGDEQQRKKDLDSADYYAGEAMLRGARFEGIKLQVEIYDYRGDFEKALEYYDYLTQMGRAVDLPDVSRSRAALAAAKKAEAERIAYAQWKAEQDRLEAEHRAELEAEARARAAEQAEAHREYVRTHPDNFFDALLGAMGEIGRQSGSNSSGYYSGRSSGFSDKDAEANWNASSKLQQRINEQSAYDAHVHETERRFGSDSAAREERFRPRY